MILELVEKPILYILGLVASIWGLIPWYLLSGGKQRHNKVQAKAIVSRDPSSPHRCLEHFQNILSTPYNGIYTLDKLFK